MRRAVEEVKRMAGTATGNRRSAAGDRWPATGDRRLERVAALGYAGRQFAPG